MTTKTRTVTTTKNLKKDPLSYLLTQNQAPGDILALTAFVRDLATFRPDLNIYVNTNCQELWDNNPHIKGTQKHAPHNVQYMKMDYGKYITEAAHSPIHFIYAYYKFFAEKTKIVIPLLKPYPDYHLSKEERATRPAGMPDRYWVIASGGKMDFTTKHWAYDRHQEVVDILNSMGIKCVQVGLNSKNSHPPNYHPVLDGTINLLNKTPSLRQVGQLIHHADGVICTITMLMHMAAALQKPCIVTAAGREEWWWEAYTKENPGFGYTAKGKPQISHRYLHTITQMDFCKTRGCWKSKVHAGEFKKESANARKKACVQPIHLPTGQIIPECMRRIETRHIVEGVLSYYMDGTIPMPPTLEQLNLLPSVGESTSFTMPDGKTVKIRVDIETPRINLLSAPAAPPTLPPLPDKIVIVEPAAPPIAVVEKTFENPVQAPDTLPVESGWTGNTDKVSICVLCYGNFAEMHRLCLNSIINTTKDRASIRVGTAAIGSESRKFLQGLQEEGKIDKIYWRDDNPGKYVIMREMFYDKSLPLNDWVIWFDDDSICNKRADWLSYSLDIVRSNFKENRHLFGIKQFTSLSSNLINNIKKCSWYRKRQFRDMQGRPAPNGSKIHFVTGGWWIISRKAIVECNIPEPTLVHNGGDILIGEQVWQGGFSMHQIGKNKEIVNWSSVARRGKSEGHWGR